MAKDPIKPMTLSELIQSLPSIGLLSNTLSLSDDERGNVVIHSEDRMKLCAWVRPFGQDDIWLEVQWLVENYPSFHVAIIKQPASDLAKHLNANCTGWRVGHCAIEGVNIKDRWIVEPDEMPKGARCPECGAKMTIRRANPLVAKKINDLAVWHCAECQSNG